MVSAGPLLVRPPTCSVGPGGWGMPGGALTSARSGSAGSRLPGGGGPGGQAGRARRVAEEIGRWHEEHAAGDRGGEVEYPVVIAGRVADEHVGQHLLDDAGAGGVADEIGAELTATGAAEWHLVPQDLPLGAAGPGGAGQRQMGVGRPGPGGQRDVGQLRAADHLLLLLGRQGVPCPHVMQVLLGDDVAAAGEPRVLGPDQHGRGGGLPTGIFRPAHETEQVAFLEVAEPVDLVLHRDRPREPVHDLSGHLEAQVHAHGLDVEKQIAGRGDGDVLRPGQFRERMQTGGPRPAEQAVPGGRADPGHARQRARRRAGAHRPLQGRPGRAAGRARPARLPG